MITAIKTTNHLNESLTLELLRPEQSGFIVLRIDGLGPPKAEISLTERAGIDGSLYNSGRAAPRNIVLGLRFYPGQNIEALRQQSYKYFPLNKPITFEVQAANRTAHATAYVEANEPNIFSSEEGCVITLVFPDSYLFDIVGSLTVFSSKTSKFEFPWSNESTDDPLLEMSELNMETTKVVIYEGDVSVGMLLHIHATGSASGFVLTDTITLETLEIDSAKLVSTTGDDIIEGDDIWISTVKGNKYAILIRGATTYNILNCLGISPVWFQLDKGDNVYAYTADSGLTDLQFEIFNDIAYEGI
jgi:hypothetical protein